MSRGVSINISGANSIVESSWDSASGIQTPVISPTSAGSTVVETESAQVQELDSNNQPTEIVATVKGAFYWTENMDIILAKQVQACIFDFDRVSETMIKQFNNNDIDAEKCRLRWADLDAGDNVNALETNFTCYVSENMINAKGHGGQPSYDSLSTMARSQFPSYLKAPNAFPSVADNSDSDDENENNINRVAITQE